MARRSTSNSPNPAQHVQSGRVNKRTYGSRRSHNFADYIGESTISPIQIIASIAPDGAEEYVVTHQTTEAEKLQESRLEDDRPTDRDDETTDRQDTVSETNAPTGSEELLPLNKGNLAATNPEPKDPAPEEETNREEQVTEQQTTEEQVPEDQITEEQVIEESVNEEQDDEAFQLVFEIDQPRHSNQDAYTVSFIGHHGRTNWRKKPSSTAIKHGQTRYSVGDAVHITFGSDSEEQLARIVEIRDRHIVVQWYYTRQDAIDLFKQRKRGKNVNQKRMDEVLHTWSSVYMISDLFQIVAPDNLGSIQDLHPSRVSRMFYLHVSDTRLPALEDLVNIEIRMRHQGLEGLQYNQ